MISVAPARTRTARAARTLLAPILGLALAASILPASAAPVAAAADGFGDELMRLTNLDRAGLGLRQLAIDPDLAALADNLPFACPSNTSMVVGGRADDFAARNYFSHDVKGCYKSDGSPYSGLDIMGQVLKFQTARAENLALNTGYGTSTVTTRTGCSASWTNCTGTTTAPSTVAYAERQFMTSSSHRANVLGNYDRFGCGSGLAADGRTYYYVCLFSLGGPDFTAPTMTRVSAPSVVASQNGSVAVSWAASDNRGVAGFQYRTRKGATGTWSSSAGTTSTSRTFAYPGPGTFYVAVRARDAAGNWSPWREASAAVPFNDSRFAFSSGGWRVTSSAYYHGTLLKTRTSGSTMTVRFTGRSFAVLAATSVSAGRMRIIVDGVSTVVDLGYYKGVRETSSHARVIVYRVNLPAGAHTATLRCLATYHRPTVNVDGVAWHD